jgi:ABC-type uncharacterized transport system permease subunit
MVSLSGISIVCFAASYGVALALEASRLFFRMPVRLMAIIGFAAAGLLAHTLYLVHRAATGAMPLSSWHDWHLIAAWILAAVYLGLVTARPQTNVGLFLLPVVLLMTLVAWLFPPTEAFPRERAMQMWGMAHGLMLLLGTVGVSLGFVAGVMYLVQSRLLKQHSLPRTRLKLPSLEWLERVNQRSLLYSSAFIGLGLLAGIVMNAVEARGGQRAALPWNDSVVISSGILLLWLVAATLFEWLYKPAQQGQKIAYLTVASFLFLALVLAMLLAGDSKHGAANAAAARSKFKVQSSRLGVASAPTLNFELGRLNSRLEAAP